MKKLLIISLCFFVALSVCACGKENTEKTPATSSNKPKNDAVVSSKTPSASSDEEMSYKDIVCTKIVAFQQVSFSVKDSGFIIFIKIPKPWKLKKNQNGYSILKNSKEIGSVTTSMPTNSQSTNVFHQEISANGMKVTNNIDRIGADKNSSYTRTFCYKYDENGQSKNIVVTFNYEEVDSSSIFEMMSTVEKLVTPQKNMGILSINDSRKKILILGNSFVSSSNIGDILQTMCGSEVTVDARSRGMATTSSYTLDNYTLEDIRSGQYSVLCMCGLFNDTDLLEMKKVIDACAASNTKLAIFPAHNENRARIDKAALLYPNTVILDWKAEIDALIKNGIAKSNFCIDDSHKHSTPLAGYVGAHMIYRAVFNKIPQSTNVPEVTQSEIALLGNYPTTGSINILNSYETYVIG